QKEASAIPFAALTAWRALKSTARIIEGQRILVVGGGGAVAFAAIQIAIAIGCHVATTCGGQSIERLLVASVEQAVDYITEEAANSALKKQNLKLQDRELQLSCTKTDSTPSKKPKPKSSPAQALGTPAKRMSLAMMSPSSSIN
ncbi:hypothetical protein S83_051391, partial [Arachis hypogaea]